MVYVVAGAAVVFLTCLTVVLVMGWRTVRRMKAFARSIAAASERIADAAATLESIKPAAAGPYTRERRTPAPEDGV